MRRYSILLIAITIIAAMSIPLLAQGPRSGEEWRNEDCPRHERGDGNPGCPYYDLRYKDLTEAQRTQLSQIKGEYANNTVSIREQLREKKQEMRSLLNSPTPDEAKILDLQKQTAKLRDQLDQEWIKYNLKVKKIVPDAKIGKGLNNGYTGELKGMPAGRCHGYEPSDQG